MIDTNDFMKQLWIGVINQLLYQLAIELWNQQYSPGLLLGSQLAREINIQLNDK
jgi:hypothetical protein